MDSVSIGIHPCFAAENQHVMRPSAALSDDLVGRSSSGATPTRARTGLTSSGSRGFSAPSGTGKWSHAGGDTQPPASLASGMRLVMTLPVSTPRREAEAERNPSESVGGCSTTSAERPSTRWPRAPPARLSSAPVGADGRAQERAGGETPRRRSSGQAPGGETRVEPGPAPPGRYPDRRAGSVPGDVEATSCARRRRARELRAPRPSPSTRRGGARPGLVPIDPIRAR